MKRLDIYKCELCGNIVESLRVGGGELVCCGRPMKLETENTVDASKEKHIPVIEKTNTGFKVTVGSVLHPMEEKHYIEWIELVAEDGRTYRKFLMPGDAPEATFDIKDKYISVRSYCNLHGLWKSE